MVLAFLLGLIEHFRFTGKGDVQWIRKANHVPSDTASFANVRVDQRIGHAQLEIQSGIPMKIIDHFLEKTGRERTENSKSIN